MKRNTIFLISLLVGFISLSSEILWIRVISYSFLTLPQIFSIVLGIFLLGIAAGAWNGKDECSKDTKDIYKSMVKILLISSVADILMILFVTFSSQFIFQTLNTNTLGFLLLAVFVSAYLKSYLFPIVHHLGSNLKENNIGKSISFIYFGNVFGSTLGPIITGYILLEYYTTYETFLILGLITFALALYIAHFTTIKYHKALWIGIALFVTLFLTKDNIKLSNLLNTKMQLDYVVENRHGIIDQFKIKNDIKVIYGMGMYDGKINTSLENDVNGIKRVYKVLTLKDRPKDVLMIGLSTGSWLQVVEMDKTIEKIDVIEINDGYIELLKHNKILSILEDKRVTYFNQDGRKYLKQNNKKYDLIIMNTTYHFRSNVSNLLSIEFLELAKKRLTNNGKIFYNTTFSPEVVKSAMDVFKSVYTINNFILATDDRTNNLFLKGDLLHKRLKDINVSDSISTKLFEQKTLENRIDYSKIDKETPSIRDIYPVTEYSKGYIGNIFSQSESINHNNIFTSP